MEFQFQISAFCQCCPYGNHQNKNQTPISNQQILNGECENENKNKTFVLPICLSFENRSFFMKEGRFYLPRKI